MDKNGYPTDDELKLIEIWDFEYRPVKDFLDLIKRAWNYADIGLYNLSGKKVLKLQLSTGGWSGNESIIEAMQNNDIFWMMCWEKSVRGGHYWFTIQIKSFPRR